MVLRWIHCASVLAAVGLTVPATAAPEEFASAEWQDLEDGLKWSDLSPGEGVAFAPGDAILVAIELWSPDRDAPVLIGSPSEPLGVILGANALIPGLERALVDAKAGLVRLVHIPAALSGGGTTELKAKIVVFGRSQPQPSKPDQTARVAPTTPPDVTDFTMRKNGLEVADLVVGQGAEARKGQAITVEYTGWVVETATKFDSSFDRSEPFVFTLGAGQVILGWDKGLRGMRVGGTRVLRIPAYLAYGASGAGSIPPHADLIFQVELLDTGT